MSANVNAVLYFLQPCTAMNGTKYLNLLKEKLGIHMIVYYCNVFLYNGTPCHRSKLIKIFLQENKYY